MKSFKRWQGILLIIISLVIITGCEFGTVKKKEKDTSKMHNIKIEIENYGTLEGYVDGTIAPISVDRFITLARSGYYDGTKFHRIIDGFVVQGGKGVGGLTPIKGEFQNNNVRNTISHTRGAISMARGNANDSATDQFFIVHKDSTYLDGNYAGIGYITSGMEIIDKVVEDTPVEDNNGTVAAENQPVIKKITVVD